MSLLNGWGQLSQKLKFQGEFNRAPGPGPTSRQERTAKALNILLYPIFLQTLALIIVDIQKKSRKNSAI